SEPLRKKRPKSGIMEKAAFCWRTPFGNRCFLPCPDGRSAGRIARDFAPIAARIVTAHRAIAKTATPICAGMRWPDWWRRLQPNTRLDALKFRFLLEDFWLMLARLRTMN